MRRSTRSASIRLAAEGATAFLASAAFFALAAVGIPLRHELVFVLFLGGVYGYVVFEVARRLGPLYGVPLAIAAGLAFDSFYIPPTREFGATHWQNWLVIAIYLLMGVLIGVLGTRSQRRAEASERARGVLAREQAALRRVATLVAQAERPEAVFAAVAEEVGVLLDVDGARVVHYLSDDEILQLEGWTAPGHDRLPVGPMKLESTSLSTEVLRTGRTVRIDNFESADRAVPWYVQDMGIRAGMAAPIVVDGQLWGAMLAWSLQPRSLPDDAESRLAAFTELVATAISNTASREELALLATELAASRARIVAAADETRRRIEHDLHDGTQQRLISLALELRTAETTAPPEASELRARLERIAEGLAGAVEDLREISRGIHPAILSEGGVGPAVKGLARRSSLPVELNLGAVDRLPQPLEMAAYYVVSEALANATKHARASVAEVDLEVRDGTLHVSIRDDGVGGADPSQGSGLLGLIDRVEALGGTIAVTSPPGHGTAMALELPVDLD